MDTLVLLLISILPVIVIGFIIYKVDKREKEPIKELVKAFLLGLAAIAITLIISLAFKITEFDVENADMLSVFLYSFIAVALVEEFSKWICGHLFLKNNKEYDYLFDGIVYFTYVGLGFAGIENILYTLDSGIVTGLIRAVSTVPAHAFFGVACGYYYSLYKKEKLEGGSNATKYLFLSLFIPFILHGFYDFCLFSQNYILIIVYIVFVVFLYIYSIGNIRKMVSIDNPFVKRKNFCGNCGLRIEDCTCTGIVMNTNTNLEEKKKNYCGNCGKKIEECICNSNTSNNM